MINHPNRSKAGKARPLPSTSGRDPIDEWIARHHQPGKLVTNDALIGLLRLLPPNETPWILVDAKSTFVKLTFDRVSVGEKSCRLLIDPFLLAGVMER
jgi:hypothetical protein